MKKPEEIKPVVDVKLTSVGTSRGFAVPKWFVDQWGLEKGKVYKIKVVSENKAGSFFSDYKNQRLDDYINKNSKKGVCLVA